MFTFEVQDIALQYRNLLENDLQERDGAKPCLEPFNQASVKQQSDRQEGARGNADNRDANRRLLEHLRVYHEKKDREYYQRNQPRESLQENTGKRLGVRVNLSAEQIGPCQIPPNHTRYKVTEKLSNKIQAQQSEKRNIESPFL